MSSIDASPNWNALSEKQQLLIRPQEKARGLSTRAAWGRLRWRLGQTGWGAFQGRQGRAPGILGPVDGSGGSTVGWMISFHDKCGLWIFILDGDFEQLVWLY